MPRITPIYSPSPVTFTPPEEPLHHEQLTRFHSCGYPDTSRKPRLHRSLRYGRFNCVFPDYTPCSAIPHATAYATTPPCQRMTILIRGLPWPIDINPTKSPFVTVGDAVDGIRDALFTLVTMDDLRAMLARDECGPIFQYGGAFPNFGRRRCGHAYLYELLGVQLKLHGLREAEPPDTWWLETSLP